MSVLYFEADVNLESCTTITEMIAKIDAIILALLTTAMKSVTNGHRVEYSVDTGQTKQKVVYSDVNTITKAIEGYRKIRAELLFELNGGEYRNVDSRNLRGRRRCGF